MTTSLSPVDVCNLALSQIGARANVSSIFPSDGSVAGDACALLYQPTVDAYARAAHWNCCRFTAQLTLLKAAVGTPENVSGTLAAPPPPWLYEYALPVDCLKARFIVPQIPQATVGGVPLTTGTSMFLPNRLHMGAVPFAVSADLDANGNEVAVVYTNIGSIGGAPWLVYTRRLTNIGLWDAQFLMGAKAALATWLVNPVSASAAMMSQAMGIAKAMLDAARISDGNEGPTDTTRDASWITFRSGGRERAAGSFLAPWDSFGFPGGSSY